MDQPFRVVIVGGGIAAGLTVAEICRNVLGPPALDGVPSKLVEIDVIEQFGGRGFWRGAAYSATVPLHLVNIPHNQMSLNDDDPLHFSKWLAKHPDPAVRRDAFTPETADGPIRRPGRSAFVPRQVYGDYIEETVEAAIESARDFVRVKRHVGVAAGHRRRQPSARDRWTAEVVVIPTHSSASDDGAAQQQAKALPYDTLVLATGNGALPVQPTWFGDGGNVPSAYVANAWDALRDMPGAVAGAIRPTAPPKEEKLSVVLVGARLTAVDVIIALRHHGFTNLDVHLVARNGLMPRANIGEFSTPKELSNDSFLRGYFEARHPDVLRCCDDTITAAVAGTREAATRQATGRPLIEPEQGRQPLRADEVARVMISELRERSLVVPHIDGNGGHTFNYGYEEEGLRGESASSGKVPWHCIIDSIRLLENAVWLSLAADERKRFLRKWKDAWEVHRHRIAPLPAAVLDEGRAGGWLTEHVGGVARVETLDSAKSGGQPSVRVHVADSKGTAIDAHLVFNCMGQSLDYRLRADGGTLEGGLCEAADGGIINHQRRADRSTSVLGDCVVQGAIVPEPNGMGLLCDPCTGRAVTRVPTNPGESGGNGGGEPLCYDYSKSIYIVGVPRRGSSWESIAVKEIRDHAKQVAAAVAPPLPQW